MEDKELKAVVNDLIAMKNIKLASMKAKANAKETISELCELSTEAIFEIQRNFGSIKEE